MKKYLILLLCLSAAAFTARAGDDRPVQLTDLPARAQQFIKSHFPSTEVSYAKVDTDWMDRSYEVVFVNGNKVEFDKQGEWKDIDCKYSSVPSALVPGPIADYVAKNHNGQAILKLDRDRRGYDVKLSSGIELEFDKRFRVVGIDD